MNILRDGSLPFREGSLANTNINSQYYMQYDHHQCHPNICALMTCWQRRLVLHIVCVYILYVINNVSSLFVWFGHITSVVYIFILYITTRFSAYSALANSTSLYIKHFMSHCPSYPDMGVENINSRLCLIEHADTSAAISFLESRRSLSIPSCCLVAS